VESRGRMVPILWNALIRVNNDPVAADRAVLGSLADQWRNEILPRYCRMVATAQEWVGTATPAELVGIVDGVGTSAGEYLFSLAIVGGSAWKMEAALAKFVRRNFSDRLGFTPKVLLRGLPGMDTETPPHAVQSVDWYRPTLGELDGQGDLSDAVADRKRTWERQRRLAAPLALGAPPKTIRSLIHGAAESARSTPVPPDAVLVGEPASPGRATGRVRIVHGPEDFRSFRDGEVFVARLTAPAWTPLFGRAAAVVTDGGTLAAHASLVAREYGIPAVVGTSEATRRLHNGQVVIVDGGAGVVQLNR
jgi:phosphohistidine swiveling domain-containing protein